MLCNEHDEAVLLVALVDADFMSISSVRVRRYGYGNDTCERKCPCSIIFLYREMLREECFLEASHIPVC